MSLIGDITGAIGSTVGYFTGGGDRDDAAKQNEDQLADVKGYDPNKYFGQLGQSQVGQLSTDPTTRAAQLKALSQLGNLSSQGGLDVNAQRDIAASLSQANANERSQRGAIQQNAQARGLGGSGAALAGLLGAEQGNANNASAGALQAGSDARNRALASLSNYANLAGTINQQDFGQRATAAGANDARQVQNANIRAQNAAAQAQKLGLLGNARGTISSTDYANASGKVAAGGAIGNAAGGIAQAAVGGFGGAPAGGGALSGGGAGAAGSALSPGNLTLDPRLFQ